MSAASRSASAALLSLALSVLAAPRASAHDFSTTVVLVVLKSDGTYGIDMTLDLDALALGVAPSTDSSTVVSELEAMSPGEFALCVERARDTLLRRVRIRFDGQKQTPWVDFPGMDAPRIQPVDPPTVLGITARLTGRVPLDAREFTFGASRAFGPVQLSVLNSGGLEVLRQMLEPGEDSRPHPLSAAPREGPWYLRPAVLVLAAAAALAGFFWIIRRVSRAARR